MKALIIEDREGMKTMLMDVLEKNGIEHTAVNTVEEAMATIQTDKDHRIYAGYRKARGHRPKGNGLRQGSRQ